MYAVLLSKHLIYTRLEDAGVSDNLRFKTEK